MSTTVQRLQYRNKRKIALHRLPFKGNGRDFWAVPATGSYIGGYQTGEALAAIYMKYLREHGCSGGSELCLIVSSMVTRAGGSLVEETPACRSLRGQVAGFLGELNAWLRIAAKNDFSYLDTLIESKLLKKANEGLQVSFVDSNGGGV